MVEARRRPEVSIPEVVTAVIDKVTEVTNVASGTVSTVPLAGAFSQWTNVSVASGATNTYGPFDISLREIKTVGTWSNTGDVRVTILVSNDGTTYKPYDTVTVTSGTSTTRSFTEAFANMRVDVLGVTDAGYTLLISRL
jgi:hypothetical protein